MIARFLLDTNVLAELGLAAPDPGVERGLHEHRAVLATAAPVVHELRYGCARLARSRRRSQYEELFDQIVTRLPVYSYDTAAAIWHAEERARLGRAGRPAPDRDAQIAAIAAVNGLALVTRNTRDFARFEGLRVVRWHES